MACNAFPGRGSGLAGLRQAGPSGDDIIIVAESEGFEPPIPLRVLLITNQVPSAARPALRSDSGRDAPPGADLLCGAAPRQAGLAERVGFEPTIRCRIHAFQACAFGRSATSPNHFTRLERKNELSSSPHSAASTPTETSTRWLRRGSLGTSNSVPAAPAFGSGTA